MNKVLSVAEVAEQYMLTLPDVVKPYIAGKAVDVAGDPFRLAHASPATEEPLYDVIECSATTVDAAVAAARHVADNSPWPHMAHNERKRVLRRLIDAIERHADELAAIQSLEVGLPLSGIQAMHMPRTMENFDFFIEVAGTMGGEAYTQTGRYTSIVTREAAGVVALISPWNAPLVLSSMKLAAALALGNSAVIKASEHSPYSMQRFIEVLHEADLPPGLINLVNGRGHVTGQALVDHPGIDVVGFVGGTETGKAIMASAARGIKKVGLELGGKSANIVLNDADVEQAIDGSLLAILAGNGEQCLAGSRILVEQGVADAFISGFVERLSNIRIGDPFAQTTELGPLAFPEHRDKVLSYVEIAASDGGELLCGGRAAAGFERGLYIEPTAVRVTDNEARVCQEEIFGPFVTVQVVSDADEAVRLANESTFGLVSYVWSNDLPTVMAVSRAIKAGTVWVNTPLTRDLRAPFGGYKMSGVGRDGLHASIELMTEEKTTMLPNTPVMMPKLGATPD
ncbi:MAG: aldehyde dehydrogenase family protein [Pseudomonadota bacterium]